MMAGNRNLEFAMTVLDAACGARFDSHEFRAALRTFATGVAVVTTASGSKRCGLTINSFNSVSLDPPMVLWSIARASPSLPVFREARRFAVNVLADDQEDLSRQFAAPAADKFAGVRLCRGELGLPLIEGAAAHFECELATTYEAGDHLIMLGRVIAIRRREDPALLVLALGGYKRLSGTVRSDGQNRTSSNQLQR
jgi:3-hydroxy-9,10-secoandrosta-1,3,5(10)-triene-9,17-dione monooxygenase reductase component